MIKPILLILLCIAGQITFGQSTPTDIHIRYSGIIKNDITLISGIVEIDKEQTALLTDKLSLLYQLKTDYIKETRQKPTVENYREWTAMKYVTIHEVLGNIKYDQYTTFLAKKSATKFSEIRLEQLVKEEASNEVKQKIKQELFQYYTKVHKLKYYNFDKDSRKAQIKLIPQPNVLKAQHQHTEQCTHSKSNSKITHRKPYQGALLW